ncbi:MAG TPA: ABC transporter substrate-binding protein [Stellaceae bacterium]|nr:ABC transporter substrate-binding protein [Stellaceae bacterium]
MRVRALIPALAFLGALALTPLAETAAAVEPTGVVNDFGDRTLKMLSDQSLSQPDREKQFGALLDQDFDFNVISRFVLGRYWLSATDQQKQDFTKVFRDYVVLAYANRFNEFSGASFKVTGQRAENPDTDIINTLVQRREGGPPAHVDWRVRKEGDGYKITEVIVDGISMSLTHRQEFAAIIERNGGNIDNLIAQIRQRTGSAPAKQ